MRLFDTHAHLADSQLEPELDSVIQRAENAGIVGIVAIGTDAQDSDRCNSLAKRFSSVWASVGFQPNGCHQATREGWDVICELAKEPRVVAIGETGLDRYWDHCPFDIQQAWFHKHIELAKAFKKPLVIHMRECESDIIETLKMHQADCPGGIMHSYTGTAKAAKTCIELGLHISFAGMVTFKKSDELRQVAKSIPLERLLIETDAPYLSPHPHRSQRPNEPSMVRHTLDCLAEIHEMPAEELAEITTQNALRIFDLDDHQQ